MALPISFVIRIIFFFFKQKTAYEIKECDWSSDVCSSDLKKDRIRENEPLQEAGLSQSVREGQSREVMPELDPEPTLGDLFDIKGTEIKDDETKELLLYHIQTGNCPYNEKECAPQICPLGEEGRNQCTFH